MMKTPEESALRSRADQIYEYRDWSKKIPPLHFKYEWNVKIIPPFGGAIARFFVEYNGQHISCYLDCYDELGYYGEPYWELYPYHNDVWRCGMMETKELMEKIEEVLES